MKEKKSENGPMRERERERERERDQSGKGECGGHAVDRIAKDEGEKRGEGGRGRGGWRKRCARFMLAKTHFDHHSKSFCRLNPLQICEPQPLQITNGSLIQ